MIRFIFSKLKNKAKNQQVQNNFDSIILYCELFDNIDNFKTLILWMHIKFKYITICSSEFPWNSHNDQKSNFTMSRFLKIA